MKTENTGVCFDDMEYPVEVISCGEWDPSGLKRRSGAVCLLLVVSGRAEAFSDNGVTAVPEGSGLMFAGDAPPELRACANGPKEDCPPEICILKFDPAFLFNGSACPPAARCDAVSAEGPWIFLDAKINGQSRLLEYARNAVRLHREKPFGYQLAVKGALCLFWYLLLRLPRAERAAAAGFTDAVLPSFDRPRISPEDENRIENALRFLEAHYTEQLSLDDIADAIPLSRSECCRCFKRALGMSPFEYLKRYRIHIAAGKLRDGDPDAGTVSGLAASVGFNSSSYFSKTFRELLNCTPLAYKKRVE